MEIRLDWDDFNGLEHINVGSQSGLDLKLRGLPKFQEHNLGGNGKISIVAGIIAMQYIFELLQYDKVEL